MNIKPVNVTKLEIGMYVVNYFATDRGIHQYEGMVMSLRPGRIEAKGIDFTSIRFGVCKLSDTDIIRGGALYDPPASMSNHWIHELNTVDVFVIEGYDEYDG